MTLGISLGSNPITGVYVGSTAATAVYFGSTKIWPAAVSLAPKAVAYSHEPVGATQTINFPAGAAAGDLCTIWIFASQPVPAISGWDSLYSYTWPSSNVAEAIIRRELTSDDITAGSLTITFGSSCVLKSVAAVWDGNDVALDVLGTASNATTGTQPLTLTAPGVTTTAKAELMAWFVAVGALGVTFSGPSGWTVNPETQSDNGLGMFVRLAYLTQDTAGATGDVSVTADDTGQPISRSGAVLLALRQKVPVITLSATFPTDLHVGDTGSFVVTATLADGATGSLTITGSSLPDGMTVGTTTDNGDGTFSATVSYDLTTEQDVTASFSATGGSVAATALVHEFNVQAAASGPELVRAFPFTFSDYHATTIPFDVGVKAGDKVIMLVETSAQRTVSSLTNPAGTPWVQDASVQGANSTYAECWSADITADAASWQPVLTPNANGYFHLTVYLLRGKTLTLDAANVVENSEIVTGAQTVTIGPYSTSGPAVVLLGMRTYCNTGTGQVTVGDSNFTTDHTDLFASRNSYTEAHALFAAAQSGNTLDVTTSGGNTTISRLIVPYTYS